MSEHEPRNVSNEWFCLHVEIPENFVDVPVANHIDDVTINSQAEAFHGTSGADGVGGHVLGFE